MFLHFTLVYCFYTLLVMYDVTNYSLCVHVQLNIEIPCKDSPVTHKLSQNFDN